jgi:predicted metal-dependent hydrolase
VILDCVAQAVRTEAAVRDFAVEREIELPRMADAAIWVEAGARALGWNSGELLTLFLENQAEVQKHIVDADLVAQAIQQLMKTREEWEGNSTDLLKALNEISADDVRRQGDWPKGARSLSNKLRMAAPGLRMTGIEVDSRVLDGKTIWTLHKTFGEKDPTYATLPTSEPAQQGDKWAKWDGFQAESYEDHREAAYKREERLAIRNEPPLSPEIREANRVLGDLPSDFDRRESRVAKNGG